MPFSQEQVDWIEAAIGRALADQQLNSWQRKFLTNVKGQFAQYGTRTRLSDKQTDKLRETLAPYRTRSADGGQRPTAPKQNKPSAAKPRPVHTPLKASTARASRKPPPRKPTWSRRQPPKRKSYRSRRRSAVPRSFRRLSRKEFWIVVVLFLAGAVLWQAADQYGLTGSPESYAVFTSPNDFTVTDGDTVKLHVADTGTRLVGFNTPETYRPRCDRGLALGQQATQRLKSLVRNAGSVELRLVRCACQPGTEGTRDCNFGRSCGVLKVDGRDVGDILVSEGLAARFVCGRYSCPRLPRPWCG